MPNRTYTEIITAAEEEISKLQASERALNAEINALKDKEWTRPLTSKDRDQLQKLRQAKAAVLANLEELAYVTLGALDQTQELQRLVNAIRGTRLTLKKELDDLKGIERVADLASDAIDGISKLEGKLKDVLQKLREALA